MRRSLVLATSCAAALAAFSVPTTAGAVEAVVNSNNTCTIRYSDAEIAAYEAAAFGVSGFEILKENTLHVDVVKELLPSMKANLEEFRTNTEAMRKTADGFAGLLMDTSILENQEKLLVVQESAVAAYEKCIAGSTGTTPTQPGTGGTGNTTPTKPGTGGTGNTGGTTPTDNAPEKPARSETGETNAASSPTDDGLGTGAIVGIVAAIVAVIAAVGFALTQGVIPLGFM